jgi:hypothetical protein
VKFTQEMFQSAQRIWENFFALNEQQLISQSIEYLKWKIQDLSLKNNCQYWSYISQGIGENLPELIDIGRRTSQFAASEAYCERIFAHLRDLTGIHRWNLRADTIQALLTIQMQCYDMIQPKSTEIMSEKIVIMNELSRYNSSPF